MGLRIFLRDRIDFAAKTEFEINCLRLFLSQKQKRERELDLK